MLPITVIVISIVLLIFLYVFFKNALYYHIEFRKKQKFLRIPYKKGMAYTCHQKLEHALFSCLPISLLCIPFSFFFDGKNWGICAFFLYVSCYFTLDWYQYFERRIFEKEIHRFAHLFITKTELHPSFFQDVQPFAFQYFLESVVYAIYTEIAEMEECKKDTDLDLTVDLTFLGLDNRSYFSVEDTMKEACNLSELNVAYPISFLSEKNKTQMATFEKELHTIYELYQKETYTEDEITSIFSFFKPYESIILERLQKC